MPRTNNHGQNGDTLDGVTSRRRRERPSQRQRQQPQPTTTLLPNFNNSRTLWILSLLLLITLLVQIQLIAHHEEFILQMDEFEEEFSGILSAANAMAYDATNAAYDFRHHLFFTANDHVNQTKLIAIYSNYSMDPIDILSRAGVDHSAGYVPSISVREALASTRKRRRNHPHKKDAELPSVEEIQSLYGNQTHILGLDRCEEYRNSVNPEQRLIGPAGLFNSATNLLVTLLRFNCVNVARINQKKKFKNFTDGILYQAPWGKHNPISWRLHHETKSTMGRLDQRDFLPIVMVKDPITWMASMCRHPYEARWPHYREHCPNLVPNRFDRRHKLGSGTIDLRVKFATRHFGDEPIPDESNKTFIAYNSLVDFWNVWYRDWYEASFPRVMIRFEDLLFHAEETVASVCNCWGGTMRPDFRYAKNSAKGQKGPHAGSAGFLASLVTYGNSTLRNQGILTDKRDVLYARKNLDEDLMTVFGYAKI